MNYFISLLIFLLLPSFYISFHCPCSDVSLEKSYYLKDRNLTTIPLQLCIDSSNSTMSTDIVDLFSKYGNINTMFNIVLVNNTLDKLKECNVLIIISTNYKYERILCPGLCYPFPIRSINEMTLYDLLNDPTKQNTEKSVTCSFTTTMIIEDMNNKHLKTLDKTMKLYHILEMIFWRILFECYESKHWKSVYSNIYNNQQIIINRRNVTSIVLWIGTIEKESLMYDQMLSLSKYPIEGTNSVLGWGADEYAFSCNEESTKCLPHQSSKASKYLPRSSMNLMKVGWRCAQRRPLRALAHILLLVNPYFVVVADDDTLVNYNLIINNFGHILFNQSYSNSIPYVIGEFIGAWGEHGHLTLKGFYGGGSGYILSQLVLRKLISYEIAFWDTAIADSYSHRSSFQIKHLSMLDDGLANLEHCEASSKSKCIGENITSSLIPILSNNSVDNLIVPIGVRLIDYCVNLMANENTCFHSDHSFGRCLVYGINLHPMGSVCLSQVSNPPSDLLVGMCFSAPECDLNKRVTCHRYKTSFDSNGNLISVRTSKNHGHYKGYSSIFDGNISDSYV